MASNNRKTKKPDTVTFSCDFCGNIWNESKRKFTMRELKFDNNKIWIQFSAECPNCKRSVSIFEWKEKTESES